MKSGYYSKSLANNLACNLPLIWLVSNTLRSQIKYPGDIPQQTAPQGDTSDWSDEELEQPAKILPRQEVHTFALIQGTMSLYRKGASEQEWQAAVAHQIQPYLPPTQNLQSHLPTICRIVKDLQVVHRNRRYPKALKVCFKTMKTGSNAATIVGVIH